MTLTIGPEMIKILGSARIINLAKRQDGRGERTGIGIWLGDGSFVFHSISRPALQRDFPSPKATGCFESHIQVLRPIANGPDASGLLIEDDCDCTSHLAKMIQSLDGQSWDRFCGFYDSQVPGLADIAAGLIAVPAIAPLIRSHFMAIKRETVKALLPFWKASCRAPQVTRTAAPCRSTAPITCFAACTLTSLFWQTFPQLPFNAHRKATSTRQVG
jgi:hypothetical protein